MSVEHYADVDRPGEWGMDVFTEPIVGATADTVRFEARTHSHEINLDFDRTEVTALHRQLGLWLGAPPQGILDACPGSGHPPAAQIPRAYQGTCSACGDRFKITGKGNVYKHRRRAA